MKNRALKNKIHNIIFTTNGRYAYLFDVWLLILKLNGESLMSLLVNKYDYKDLKRESVDGKRLYACPDGNSVASVTTILDKTKDKTALIEWRKRVGEKKAQEKGEESPAAKPEQSDSTIGSLSMTEALEARWRVGDPMRVGVSGQSRQRAGPASSRPRLR